MQNKNPRIVLGEGRFTVCHWTTGGLGIPKGPNRRTYGMKGFQSAGIGRGWGEEEGGGLKFLEKGKRKGHRGARRIGGQ